MNHSLVHMLIQNEKRSSSIRAVNLSVVGSRRLVTEKIYGLVSVLGT